MAAAQSRSELAQLPHTFGRTRFALHRVAEEIVAPARKPDNEISLRATPGGFGTPAFDHLGTEHQVIVDGDELVHLAGGSEERVRITSLQQSGLLVIELLPSGTRLDSEPLAVDRDSALALGAWFAFGAEVLEQLRSEAGGDADPTIARLWPEHFDLAIESGDEGSGRRANYGFSPGDAEHPEPYLYVGPWRADVSGDLWNATAFTGAELAYSELAGLADPYGAAIAFCRERRDQLDLG